MGTAPAQSSDGTAQSVHPHVRGDGGPDSEFRADAFGSPPRAWGRRGSWSRPTSSSRFTPTCVGTAQEPSFSVRGVTVHPHVRGDGELKKRIAPYLGGSPPRAWGRPGHRGRACRAHRFTPTCVGTALLPSPSPVHPHVRGDGVDLYVKHMVMVGSPPRAWGRLSCKPSCWASYRFTPTCVGTASGTSRPWLPTSVHPHVRGDGAPRSAAGALQLRFTPTCVGTARTSQPRIPPLPVHPHVRGDGVASRIYAAALGGSPPRAWGRLAL